MAVNMLAYDKDGIPFFTQSTTDLNIVDGEYDVHELLNFTGCPICSDDLYWEVKIVHDHDLSIDKLVFESSCCGKTFIGELIDGKVYFIEE